MKTGMKTNYYMPTRILAGSHCIFENRSFLKELGDRALIVTGKHSAKANGAYGDAVKALEANGQTHVLYDQVVSNPTVDNAFEAAEKARREGCGFIVAIGGGSPLDTAKAAAALALREIDKAEIFRTAFTAALPIAAVPTTAGTGSEVTPYAILTNDPEQTKTSISSPALFARFAFLDAAYTEALPRRVTVNTAIDALSHAIEGMLSVRASAPSDLLARESVRLIAECFDALGGEHPGPEARWKLLYASTLAGMVIANTGTTAVHALGYMLTYFKHVDHGRANGLFLAQYLKFVEEKEGPSGRVRDILGALRLGTIGEFSGILNRLLEADQSPAEKPGALELEDYADRSIKAKNIQNCAVKPDRDDLLRILRGSLIRG
jgi:alcohol dehydrogenase class IV